MTTILFAPLCRYGECAHNFMPINVTSKLTISQDDLDHILNSLNNHKHYWSVVRVMTDSLGYNGCDFTMSIITDVASSNVITIEDDDDDGFDQLYRDMLAYTDYE